MYRYRSSAKYYYTLNIGLARDTNKLGKQLSKADKRRRKMTYSDKIKVFGKEHPIFGINTYRGQYIIDDIEKFSESISQIVSHLGQTVENERKEIFQRFMSKAMDHHSTLQDLEETIEQSYISFLDYEQRRKWFPYIAVGTSLLMFALLNFLVKW